MMFTNVISLKENRCDGEYRFVPLNVQSARQETLLYVFEDNEAVIRMISKGRSSTKRHVFRTHRVGLDWLFGRVTRGSANCLCIVFLPAGMITSLTFCCLPGEGLRQFFTCFSNSTLVALRGIKY